MVNITFGQCQESSVDGYNNVCKVLFFLWLADTSLSCLFFCEFKKYICNKINIKVLSQFQNLNILLFFQKY